MRQKETQDLDFIFEHELNYINFNVKPSPLGKYAWEFLREEQVGLELADSDPVKFFLHLEAVIPRKPELYVPWYRRHLLSDPPLVWKPDIHPALRRHLQGDPSVKPDEQDKQNFVILPQGSRVGATLVAVGATDRLVSTTTPWSQLQTRPNHSSLKHQIDAYGQIIETKETCFSREGIMAEVSVNNAPLALRETSGEFGPLDPRFQEIYRPFTHIKSAARQIAFIDIARHDIFSSRSNSPDTYNITVRDEPIVIDVNIFEGTEDLMNQKTVYFKGSIPPFLVHQPNSETCRCPACGMVGMDNSSFDFGQDIIDLNYREIRPGTASRIGGISLAVITPEIAEQAVTGKALDSCDSCYPAACHNLHWSRIDSVTPYPCHDFTNNRFCDEHLPSFEMLFLQRFPDSIREEIVKRRLGENGVAQDRFVHKFLK